MGSTAPSLEEGEQPTLITLTPAELASQQMSARSLEAALTALHRDGLVVLANAVSPAHLDALNAAMVPDAVKLYAEGSTHRNFGAATGNIQQEPPTAPDLLFDDVVANPFATAVTACALGPRPALRFFSANTAFKAEGRQPVHIDVDFPFPRFPWGYCVNINLVDTSPRNGATEVWLGTHADTDAACMVDVADGGTGTHAEQIRPDLLEARRRVRPPVQPSLPKGSVVVRDFRLWHAGMPNRTDEPRVMLVAVHFPHWWRSGLRIKLPESARGKVRWGELDPQVEWMADGYDYLKGAHDFTFAQDP